VFKVTPRHHPWARPHDGIFAFLHLVGHVPAGSEPGARSVKKSVAQRNSLEVRGIQYTLLNLQIGLNAGGNGRRGAECKRVLLRRKSWSRCVEESSRLHKVAACAGSFCRVVNIVSTFKSEFTVLIRSSAHLFTCVMFWQGRELFNNSFRP